MIKYILILIYDFLIKLINLFRIMKFFYNKKYKNSIKI